MAFKIDERITLLFRKIAEVEKQDITRSAKTQKLQRLAKAFMKQLHESGLSEKTIVKYISKTRKEIYDANLRHHNLDQQLEVIYKYHPELKDELNKLLKLPMSHAIQGLVQLQEKYNGQPVHKRLQQLQLGHEVLRFIRMGDLCKKLEKEYNQLVQDRHRNPITVNYQWLLNTIESLLTEKTKNGTYSYSRLALGLALATGRRAIEILYQGKFSKHGESQYQIEFKGAAKKRMSVGEGVLYTIVPAELVMKGIWHLRRLPEIKALQSFKHLPEGERNALINQRCARTLNDTTKLVFGDNDALFKDSRNLYGQCVKHMHYDTWRKEHKGTETAFLQDMFLHENISTHTIYTAWQLDFTEYEIVEIPRKELKKTRLAIVDKFREHEDAKAASIQRLLDVTEELIKEDPQIVISQTMLRKKSGSGVPVIKRYLSLVGDEINQDIG
ncbi:protelomerase family protein [Zooshikella sp. RANM57]|uniref:protelomerase family protein n=1 Tax=Zooshikella sp. RANM57 TaxID=3425863 RepID=UPI003D6DF274